MKKSKEEERLDKTLSRLKVANENLQKEIDEASKVKTRFNTIKVAFIGALSGGFAGGVVAFILTKIIFGGTTSSDVFIGGAVGGVFSAITINNWWFDFIYEKGWLKKIGFNFSDK
tara:strand:- start:309 stop:653 length:345 start_codon:yes stop_codon:yes gene_type:complete